MIRWKLESPDLEKSPVSKVVLADPVINSGAIQQPLTSDFETSFQSNLSVLNFDAMLPLTVVEVKKPSTQSFLFLIRI